MKKILSSLIVGAIIFYSALSMAKHFWRGPTLSTDKVCKKWGETPFDSKKFHDGNYESRAEMSCALLKNQSRFIGKDRSEIRTELGNHDGYYFTDMFPAYIIQNGKSKTDETWQLVFLMNKDQKISEVIMHKNCCN